MSEPNYNYVVDYLVSSGLGNIKPKNGKKLNKLIIDNKEYSYNKENHYQIF